MLQRITASSMLNAGSVAACIAFPLLHRAAFGDSPGMLVPGMALTAFSMLAPFIARACKQ
jgi:hypothetical protein